MIPASDGSAPRPSPATATANQFKPMNWSEEILPQALGFLANLAVDFKQIDSVYLAVAGGLLLLFGKKLYWIILILLSLVAGAWLGLEVIPQEPDWLKFVIPVVTGATAAFICYVLHRLALQIAGICIGGLLGYLLIDAFFVKPWPLVGLCGGCLLGLLLVIKIFDWSLVLLSALSGAALLGHLIPVELWLQGVFALVFFVIGLAFQSWMESKKKKPKEKNKDKSD